MISTIRKILLEGDSVSDDAITFYISLVKDMVRTRCKAEIYPVEMDHIAIDVVVSFINRRGKEGFSSESEGDIRTDMLGNLLAPYAADFDAFAKSQGAGKMRFL